MKQFITLFKRPAICMCMMAAFILFSATAKSQAPDSKGTDFWLTFPGNYQSGATLSLFISGDINTTGTVTIPGLGYSSPFTVTAGTVTTVVLPSNADLGATSSAVVNKGIHVTSGQEITIYGLSRIQATTDAFLALPTDILGTEYINLGYKNVNIVNGTQLAVVASQNATVVTITPTVTTDGHTAGVPYNVSLNQGEAYQLRNTGSAPNDLSGSLVTSNKPIGVFGGHQCANIPDGNTFACDFIVEQLPPVTSWGKNFITVPLKSRIGGDSFRFMAAENGTTVNVNGVLVATLNKGQFHERILTAASQVTSNKPILVAQYSNGTTFDNVTSDPFMMLITPYEQYLGNYTFATPASGFSINFVNVVAPPAAIGSLKLDGTVIPAAQFTPVGSTGFSRAQLNLTLGAHTINGTNLPFGIFVYGFDNADSYGYPGGQSLSPIASVTSLVVSPKTGSAPIGTEQCFEALVKDQFNNPVIGVRVDFNITGANPGSTGFVNTNANGVARFCYTGANTGVDNIVASLGTLNDAATFTWTPRSAGNIYYSKAAGDLHNVLTWGLNPDGSGANPPDFTAGKIFQLANRPNVYTMTADWSVGGTVNIPSSSQLQINGFTFSIANLGGTGTISGSLTSNLTALSTTAGNITFFFTPGSNSLNNLTINQGAAAYLSSNVDLYNTLTVDGFFEPATDLTKRYLTFKSGPAMTARIAPLITGTLGDGYVNTETYIPARRAWRLINSAVKFSTTMPTSWKEGATSAGQNPAPGFGTHITGGPLYENIPGTAFDINPVGAMSSVKRYTNATGTWDPLPSISGVGTTSPYMLFIRGDRGISLGYNTVPPTVTRLRDNGALNVGEISRAVEPTGFTTIPNLYQSPVNFATLTRSNVQNNFYVWDPKMGGANGVGAYVLISYNGSSYDVIPAAVSPESQYIQINQSFMVRPNVAGTPGTITFKETDKVPNSLGNVFRTGNGAATPVPNAPVIADPKAGQGLRISLEVMNPDQTPGILDEVFASYKSSFSEKVDNMDAVKMTNEAENLGIVRDGQVLSLERKPMVEKQDVIALKLWNTTARQYVLEINPVNLNGAGLTATLEDAYLQTSTPLSLTEISKVVFSVNTEAASSRSDRFKVVLSSKNALLNSITATEGKPGVSAFPNPIDGKTITLLFGDKAAGIYQVRLMNSAGQVVFRKSIQHAGGTASQTLDLGKKIQKGMYQLQVSSPTEMSNIKLSSN